MTALLLRNISLKQNCQNWLLNEHTIYYIELKVWNNMETQEKVYSCKIWKRKNMYWLEKYGLP